MPRFKVELHRRIRDNYGHPEPNPFLAPLAAPGATSNMSVRSWEFEATDETEVRRLLKEAQDNDLPHVRGYSLRSIQMLTESEEVSR